MGVGVSKLHHSSEDGVPAGLKKKIDDARHRRRERTWRNSIVSTAELLHEHDLDVIYEEALEIEKFQTPMLSEAEEEDDYEDEKHNRKNKSKKIVPDPIDIKITKKEENKDKIGEKTRRQETMDLTKKSTSLDSNVKNLVISTKLKEDDDEKSTELRNNLFDQPGSPSFRFYCVDNFQHARGFSVDFGQLKCEDETPKIKDVETANQVEDCAQYFSPTLSEASRSKSQKKEKGKRLKSLIKIHSSTNRLLNVRGCYKSHPVAIHHQTPHLLADKANSLYFMYTIRNTHTVYSSVGDCHEELHGEEIGTLLGPSYQLLYYESSGWLRISGGGRTNLFLIISEGGRTNLFLIFSMAEYIDE